MGGSVIVRVEDVFRVIVGPVTYAVSVVAYDVLTKETRGQFVAHNQLVIRGLTIVLMYEISVVVLQQWVSHCSVR